VHQPAAIKQLQILGESIGVEVFSMGTDADPVKIAAAAVLSLSLSLSVLHVSRHFLCLCHSPIFGWRVRHDDSGQGRQHQWIDSQRLCFKCPDDKICTGIDFLPLLLSIPRIDDWRGGFNLLGLGDIVCKCDL
jgi:hypothetical protein